ncbi:hypothetical protein CEXT_665491 [Caerostris extrusa]|uniref:Uncharacterized protein n=1 Tax=Caerostris extrusa TaxID=172846 RepID=A0AAV4U3M4_CAEEX|nr:hypothetical protein CEXT_665491 [Caerostris extrusa]
MAIVFPYCLTANLEQTFSQRSHLGNFPLFNLQVQRKSLSGQQLSFNLDTQEGRNRNEGQHRTFLQLLPSPPHPDSLPRCAGGRSGWRKGCKNGVLECKTVGGLDVFAKYRIDNLFK